MKWYFIMAFWHVFLKEPVNLDQEPHYTRGMRFFSATFWLPSEDVFWSSPRITGRSKIIPAIWWAGIMSMCVVIHFMLIRALIDRSVYLWLIKWKSMKYYLVTTLYLVENTFGNMDFGLKECLRFLPPSLLLKCDLIRFPICTLSLQHGTL